MSKMESSRKRKITDDGESNDDSQKAKVVKKRIKEKKSSPPKKQKVSQNDISIIDLDSSSQLSDSDSDFSETIAKPSTKSKGRPVKKAVTKKPSKVTKKAPTKRVVKKKVPIDEDESPGVVEIGGEDIQFPIWDSSIVLSNLSGVPLQVAQNFIQLIEDDNTLPFIARYRKSMVDNMTPESLQELFDCFTSVSALKKKALSILKTLKKSDKLSPDLERSIICARNISELDLLYEPLKKRSGTLAERAREIGLESVALTILNGGNVNIPSLCNCDIDGLKTPEEVEENIVHLLAEMMYKDSRVLEKIRQLKSDTKMYIESTKARAINKTKKAEEKVSKTKVVKRKDDDADKYKLYLEFKMRVDYIKPHQILALNRGEAAKILSIKIEIPDWFYNNLERFCTSIWRGPLIRNGVSDAYKRLIKPWLTRQVRSEMTARAEKESIAVFASNLKRLLMTAPIKGNTILGIDPGFKAGCKIGIVNSLGQVLDTYVLYPIFHQHGVFDKESVKIKQLIDIYKCEVIALGNGTACRETEQWLKTWGITTNLPLVIVPEQGASIYSCSPEASKEHPGMDPNLISAVSIARRALDPLSELVKVEPKHVGVGLYQHDAPPKLLNEALNHTVVSCASFVGADLNTASEALLRKIAGLTETRAKSIIKYREKNGGFSCREELLKVTGIGPKVFKQCAGFLRLPQSTNKLDNTWIHPESYKLAIGLLKEVKLSVEEVGTQQFLRDFRMKTSALGGAPALASKLNCPQSDAQLIVDALSQSPHEDPLRNNKPIYSMAFDNIGQLREGAKLTGVVSNVTPFGSFVDCGVGRDGLIHTSQMNGFRVPQLGERVVVTVIPPLTDKRLPLKLDEIIN